MTYKIRRINAWHGRHPTRLWNFMSEEEKKETEPFFTEQCFNTSVVYNMEVLEHFFAQKCMHEDLI